MMHTTTVVLHVTHDRYLPELKLLIANRTWTIDGVKDVIVEPGIGIKRAVSWDEWHAQHYAGQSFDEAMRHLSMEVAVPNFAKRFAQYLEDCVL